MVIEHGKILKLVIPYRTPRIENIMDTEVIKHINNMSELCNTYHFHPLVNMVLRRCFKCL